MLQEERKKKIENALLDFSHICKSLNDSLYYARRVELQDSERNEISHTGEIQCRIDTCISLLNYADTVIMGLFGELKLYNDKD